MGLELRVLFHSNQISCCARRWSFPENSLVPLLVRLNGSRQRMETGPRHDALLSSVAENLRQLRARDRVLLAEIRLSIIEAIECVFSIFTARVGVSICGRFCVCIWHSWRTGTLSLGCIVLLRLRMVWAFRHVGRLSLLLHWYTRGMPNEEVLHALNLLSIQIHWLVSSTAFLLDDSIILQSSWRSCLIWTRAKDLFFRELPSLSEAL